MAGLTCDLKRSLRNLSGALLLGAVVLGVGIGTTTGVLNLMNAALWRPLPVERPSQLVAIYRTNEERVDFGPSSYPDFAALRQGSRTLSGLVASGELQVAMRHDRGADVVWCGVVSSDYFQLLGVSAARGRVLQADDAMPQGPRPVVLSHRYWSQRFGRDPAVIGEEVRMDDEPAVVVGVAAEPFTGTIFEYSLDCWIPIRAGDSGLEDRGVRWLTTLIGRRAPGASLDAARQELSTIARRLSDEYPDTTAGMELHVVPLRLNAVPLVREGYYRLYGLLLLAAGFVLLASCSNLASLLLARAVTRRHDHAVSMVLGARRRHLFRSYLLDSAVLCLGAGLVALGVALWIGRIVEGMLPAWEATLAVDLSFDGKTWLAFAGLIVACTLIIGCLPAVVALRTRMVRDLQARSTSSRRTVWLRRALVVAQIPLSLVLLVAAGLLLQSLTRAYHVDIGFDSRDVVVVGLAGNAGGDAGGNGEPAGAVETARRRAVEEVRSLPGVETASLAQGFPFGFNWSGGQLPATDGSGQPLRVNVDAVGPDFFAALDVPVLAGRTFDPALDRAGGRPVAVISLQVAEWLWPGEDAVGRLLPSLGADDERLTVVGVVGDLRSRRLQEEPLPFVYLPIAQASLGRVSLVIEARRGLAARLLPEVRQRVRASAPELPLEYVRTLDSFVYFFQWQQRLLGLLVGLLGVVAVVLAVLGLYGTLSYITRGRAQDIAVRMALGADRRNVVVMVVRQAMVMAGLGLVLGLLAAAAVSRILVAGFLFETDPLEPWIFGVAFVTLAGLAGISAWLPARRAAHVEPQEGLRIG